MEFSFDFEMTKENKKVIEELLKQKGIKHYVLETKDKEKLDLVEYKEYKNLEKEKQELIDYLKEQIKETKDSWGNCIYYNNEKGMLEILITLRLLEEILNKIEKR